MAEISEFYMPKGYRNKSPWVPLQSASFSDLKNGRR
jgi:hypothetical protein